ncbi:MAG: proline racemase family protein [Litorimonas sp.]
MFVIDSHTGGQPTRVIIVGGPDLGDGPIAERAKIFEAKHDVYRKKCVLEPKCSDAMVGALLCEPHNPDCAAGVIFFNTAGYLGMCGHGTIGLIVTLAQLGKITPGLHLIETPAGIVKTRLLSNNEVEIENVESYCLKKNVKLEVEGLGQVTGSVAWGGNWFFLVESSPMALTPENIPALTIAARRVRDALSINGVTGANSAEVDHIEFFETPKNSLANSRNFVLCPGGAYDRSPCGTGTSAKLACLSDAGLLASREVWVQESIIGSRFRARYHKSRHPGRIIPTIIGEAHIYGETKLLFDPADPFQYGIEL